MIVYTSGRPTTADCQQLYVMTGLDFFYNLSYSASILIYLNPFGEMVSNKLTGFWISEIHSDRYGVHIAKLRPKPLHSYIQDCS